MFAGCYECGSTQKCFHIVPSGYVILHLPADVLQAVVKNIMWDPLSEHPEEPYCRGTLQMTCASPGFALSSHGDE